MEEFANLFGVKENNFFTKEGQIDFDKLNPLERDEYLKMLEVVQTSQVTLEDFKKFVSQVRVAIDTSLVDEPDYIYSSLLPFLKRPNPKIQELKARLKNFIIFERFLFKSDMAKAALDAYKGRLEKK